MSGLIIYPEPSTDPAEEKLRNAAELVKVKQRNQTLDYICSQFVETFIKSDRTTPDQVICST